MATAVAKIEKREASVRITEPEPDGRSKPPPLELSTAGTSMDLPKTPTRKEKEKKLGHRRVDDAGQVTYKKKPTSELMSTIQLGIGQSITILSTKPKRDLLLQDFTICEQVFFPREGSNLTPAHHYSDFRFKTFAPIAFRYFRELFSIQPDDFLLSLCNEPLHELSNPGASGSIFYITDDDEFIIKTVQHKESEFLQKLLPGYYMNLNQNPRTLLPKFYGLYCYQCGGKNIRFVVMNNLLPTAVKMHERYDMKGSTYKRKASKRERSKRSPTLKDLDFLELHPEGIMLEADTYSALINTINRDCRVLQSFKIMDYSLLLGVHNLDTAARERLEDPDQTYEEEGGGGYNGAGTVEPSAASSKPGRPNDHAHNTSISRGKSMRQRVAQYSTAMEAIQARSEPLELDNEDIPIGGIPARNQKGERLLLYIGLIDILQNYRLKKKMEHAFKAMVHDGDTISVHRPGFYATRFQNFFANKVFRKIPSSLKHSPSKKRGISSRQRSVTTSEVEGRTATYLTEKSFTDKLRTSSDTTEPAGAVGGRPDLLPENSTPPPTFAEALSDRQQQQTMVLHSMQSQPGSQGPEVIATSPSFQSGSPGAVGLIHSPVHSISESTPTHTEYTEDSLPSTTKSIRREFNGSVTSTPPPSTTVITSQQVTTSSTVVEQMVEVSHEQIEFELPPDVEASKITEAANQPAGGSGELLNNSSQPSTAEPDEED